MTRARAGALLLLVCALAAAAWAIGRGGGSGTREDRPVLLLLTSLPLVFTEEFSLDQKGSPLLAALGSRYKVEPVDVTDPATLARAKLMMIAQPHAQTAENLVALDEWVRGGGRLLLFADPMLEWPSERALGDPTRPPPMFADTGLLAHWGLRLDAPDQRGAAKGRIGAHIVLTMSPGSLVGGCAIEAGGLAARCTIGKGKAVIVADADLLDLEGLGAGASGNAPAVLAQLESLESQ